MCLGWRRRYLRSLRLDIDILNVDAIQPIQIGTIALPVKIQQRNLNMQLLDTQPLDMQLLDMQLNGWSKRRRRRFQVITHDYCSLSYTKTHAASMFPIIPAVNAIQGPIESIIMAKQKPGSLSDLT